MNKLQEHTISYILPPETIDLSYLYKCLKERKGEIKPLWCNLDNDSKYYHIEIHSTEIYEDDCSSENVDTYVCQICNSYVPQMYYKEHNESETHLIFKRICENVLERVSKQLNVNFPYNCVSVDTFCCHTCNKVVKIVNRSKHVQSEHHAQAVDRQKLMNEFYKTFLNIDDDDDSCTYSVASKNNLVDDKDKPTLQDSNNRFLSSNDREVDYDSDKSSIISTSQSLTVKSQTEGKENGMLNISKPPTIEQPEEISFETYLKEVINKFNLMILPPQTEGDSVLVKASTGSKVKVSREHFHSFIEVSNKTYCQICKIVPEDVSAHEGTERHVMKLFKTINEHFAREMDHIYSHCLVCNEVIVTQSDHHRINDNHNTILNQNNLHTPSVNTKIETPKTLCEFCNVSIDTHNFLGHRGSKKHKINELRLFRHNNINIIEKDQYFCKVCKINLNFNAIYKHVNEKVHFTKNIEYNKTYNHTELCDVCCESQSQIANNDNIINNSNNPGSSSESFKIVTHPIDTLAIVKSDSLHLHTPSVKAKIGNKKTLCEICNVSIDTHNFKSHNGSKKHKTKEKSVLRHNNINKVNKDLYFCNVCKVNLNFNAIYKHVNEEAHLYTLNAHYNKTQTTSCIYKVEVPSNSEFCEVCKVKVPKGGMTIHIKGGPHSKRLLSLITKANNETNVIEIKNKSQIANNDNGVINNIIKSASSREENVKIISANQVDASALTKTHYSQPFKDTNKPTVVFCRPCEKEVPNTHTNMTEHIKGSAHKAKVNKLY